MATVKISALPAAVVGDLTAATELAGVIVSGPTTSKISLAILRSAVLLGGSGYTSGDVLALGGTPATSGAIRLSNNTGIFARNSGNSANVEALAFTSGNVVRIAGYALWPASDGTANYVLQTDGSGNLSWVAQSGGGGSITGSGTSGKLTKWTGSSAVGDSIVSESGTVLTVTGTLVVTGSVFTIRSIAWTFPSADAAGVIHSNGSGTLSLSTIVNADVSSSAAIGYSKLNLTGTILNADLAGSIALSKLVAVTASRALVSDGSGFVSASSVTATELGYVSGVTSAIQTQLGTLLPLAGGTLTGNLLFSTDNTKDVGASGATRPRTLYVGTSVITPLLSNTGSTIGLRGVTYTLPSADGSNTYVLSTNGSGVLSWVAPGGGGTISGLTTGTIPKAASSTSVADSIITESSGVITVTGTLVVTGTTLTIRSIAWAFPSADAAGVMHSNGSGALSLSTVVNADVSSSAAIAWSKINATGAVANADLAGSIADSKLSTITTAGKVSSGALITSINAQTGTTYTTVLADDGKVVTCSNASAITVTIPPNSSVAYVAGATITVIQKGAGTVTIAAGSGVTLRTPDTLALRKQYSAVTITQSDTTDTWFVNGDLT